MELRIKARSLKDMFLFCSEVMVETPVRPTICFVDLILSFQIKVGKQAPEKDYLDGLNSLISTTLGQYPQNITDG